MFRKTLYLPCIFLFFWASSSLLANNNIKKPLDIYLSSNSQLTGHPLTSSDQIDFGLKSLLYGPLFRIGEDWEFECELCEVQPTFENKLVEISRSRHGSGKISVEIQLKKDARWADGVAISGHDIVFSWKVGAKLSDTLEHPTIYDRIESISVPRGRPKVAKVILKGAYYQNKILDEFYIIPRHLEEPIWNKSGKVASKYLSDSLYTVDPSNPGLYYKSYVPLNVRNNSIKLTVNRFNMANKPDFTSITLHRTNGVKDWIKSNNFKNSVYINSDFSDVNFTNDEHLKNIMQLDETHKRISEPTLYWEQAVFNQRNPILNDKKIRKAVIHAIDWKAIAKLAGEDNIITSSSFEPPFSPFYIPEPPYLYSKKLATQLIKSAGWIKDENGIYVKGKEPLEFNIVVLKDNSLRLKIAEQVANNLKEIGFQTSLYPKSKPFLMNRVIKEGRFTGLAFYGIKMDANIAPRTIFHSHEIPSSLNDYLGQNVGVWYSKDVDNTLDNLRASLTRPKREKYFKLLQSQYTAEIPGLSIFYHRNFNQFPKSIVINNLVPGEPIIASLASWSNLDKVKYSQK